jgi:hypothetical protein
MLILSSNLFQPFPKLLDGHRPARWLGRADGANEMVGKPTLAARACLDFDVWFSVVHPCVH